jgi:hypothetical protein
MPELPRLNNLIRLAYVCADDSYGIFQSNTFDRGVKEPAYETQCRFLLTPFEMEPPGS